MKRKIKILGILLIFITIILNGKIIFGKEIVINGINNNETTNITLEQKEEKVVYIQGLYINKVKVTKQTLCTVETQKETGTNKINDIQNFRGTKVIIKAKSEIDNTSVIFTGSLAIAGDTTSHKVRTKVIVKKNEELAKIAEEAEQRNLETAYRTVPSKQATAQQIKDFILSDSQYNNSKALKKVAKNNISKIKKWSQTVNAHIATDSHYASPSQYGSIRDTLTSIIEASENGGSIDDAVSSNSDGLSSSYETESESLSRIRRQLGSIVSDGERSTNAEFSDVLDDVNGYNPGNIDGAGANKIKNKTSIILSNISTIGIVISVIILAVLGIKYIFGSIEEKAEYKKDMIPYLIGVVLLLSITTVVKILISLGTSINNI